MPSPRTTSRRPQRARRRADRRRDGGVFADGTPGVFPTAELQRLELLGRRHTSMSRTANSGAGLHLDGYRLGRREPAHRRDAQPPPMPMATRSPTPSSAAPTPPLHHQRLDRRAELRVCPELRGSSRRRRQQRLRRDRQRQRRHLTRRESGAGDHRDRRCGEQRAGLHLAGDRHGCREPACRRGTERRRCRWRYAHLCHHRRRRCRALHHQRLDRRAELRVSARLRGPCRRRHQQRLRRDRRASATASHPP